MPRLDPAASSAVEAYAAQMGLRAAPDAAGAYGFEFRETGRLAVLAGEDGAVLVSLTRRVILGDLIGVGALLAAGGHHPGSGLLAQPGLTRSGQPVLTLAFPERGFDLPTLDGAVAALQAMFAEAGL